MSDKHFSEVWTKCHRKTATAAVRIRAPFRDRKDQVNMVFINDLILPRDYFSDPDHIIRLLTPFVLTESSGKFDVWVRLIGGGKSAQAQAASVAIARGITQFKPSCKAILKEAGLLATDSRQVERKHYGYKKARRGFQFSKR